MKIATWNVNSLRIRLPQLLEWAALIKLDVIAVQETKVTDKDFPIKEIEDAGYHVAFSGQKTFNGVAILSKKPLKEIVTDLPAIEDKERRVLAATIGDTRVLNLYVPNGQSVDSEKYHYKLKWFEALHDYVKAQLKKYPKLVLVGDFNVAPEDRDVYDPAAWAGNVLVSSKERKALQKVMALGLSDAFRSFDQPEKSYSWWDYRRLAFQRNRGLRLDLILVSETLAKKCKSCSIDKSLREADRPSDHTAVVAEF